MKQKHYLILGVIVVFAVVGAIIFVRFPQGNSPNVDEINPTVSLEATIMSIEKKDVCPVDELPCSVALIPDDWVNIRIDRIVEYKGSWWNDPRANYEPINEGNVRKVKICPGKNDRSLKVNDKIRFTSTYAANILHICGYEVVA